MIAIPALELREGICVQLAPGAYDQEVMRIPDPAGVARAWREYGFRNLHVVDLDRMAGRGNNDTAIQAIIGATDAAVQVDGGIRSEASIEHLLNNGAQRVVIGSLALEDLDWLADMARLYPGCVVVAVDVRDRRVLSRGWLRPGARIVLDLIEEIDDLPLAGLLVTAADREEGQRGTYLQLIEDVVETAEFPIFAAAGRE